MARRRARLLLVLLMVGAAGCSNASQLLRSNAAWHGGSATTTTEASAAEGVYLERLGAEQARLSAAEARIPTSPRTPAALARSVGLLAIAVRRLADGLAEIRAPASVASEHAHLVAIIRSYAAALDRAARIAVTSDGEPRAGRLLIAATNQASRAFTSTIASIDSTLGGSAS